MARFGEPAGPARTQQRQASRQASKPAPGEQRAPALAPIDSCPRSSRLIVCSPLVTGHAPSAALRRWWGQAGHREQLEQAGRHVSRRAGEQTSSRHTAPAQEHLCRSQPGSRKLLRGAGEDQALQLVQSDAEVGIADVAARARENRRACGSCVSSGEGNHAHVQAPGGAAHGQSQSRSLPPPAGT